MHRQVEGSVDLPSVNFSLRVRKMSDCQESKKKISQRQ